MRWYKQVGFLCILLTITACKSDRLDITVPEKEVAIGLVRMEQDFVKITSVEDAQMKHRQYEGSFPELYAYYLGACLQAGRMEDSLVHENLYLFLRDTFMSGLNSELVNRFSDFPEYELIKNGFRYYSYYFPESTLPEKLVTYNSAFSNSVISSPHEIGIGLERYLGADDPFIKKLPEQVFFQYIKKQMERKFMVRDAMMSWIGSNHFPEVDDNLVIAEQLVHWGKLLYLVEATLPRESKAVLLRYDEEEYKWAEENEIAFWKYLVEENFLFKREQKVARNIFSDGPFTPGLPIEEKAPPRLGQFLGWKIVKQYMDENKAVELKEMISVDYKTILKTYKPE